MKQIEIDFGNKIMRHRSNHLAFTGLNLTNQELLLLKEYEELIDETERLDMNTHEGYYDSIMRFLVLDKMHDRLFELVVF